MSHPRCRPKVDSKDINLGEMVLQQGTQVSPCSKMTLVSPNLANRRVIPGDSAAYHILQSKSTLSTSSGNPHEAEPSGTLLRPGLGTDERAEKSPARR